MKIRNLTENGHPLTQNQMDPKKRGLMLRTPPDMQGVGTGEEVSSYIIFIVN